MYITSRKSKNITIVRSQQILVQMYRFVHSVLYMQMLKSVQMYENPHNLFQLMTAVLKIRLQHDCMR